MGCVCSGGIDKKSKAQNETQVEMEVVFRECNRGYIHFVEPSSGALERIWQKIDADGSGFLDRMEVKQLLQNYFQLSHEKFSSEHIQQTEYNEFQSEMFGLALMAQSFVSQELLQEFESDPQIAVDHLISELDLSDSGNVSKEDFMKQAPIVLFNQTFFAKAHEIFSKNLLHEKLHANLTMAHARSTICEQEVFERILACTPAYLYWLTWKKLFDLNEDGTSFTTLIDRVGGARETLIIVKTNEGDIIGAFTSVPLKFDGKVGGNSDCFVFSVEFGELQQYKNIDDNHQGYWCIDKENIRFGIDKKQCSLFIGENFSRGTSQSSATFGNHPPLTQSTEFKISAVEVWATEE